MLINVAILAAIMTMAALSFSAESGHIYVDQPQSSRKNHKLITITLG